MLQGNSNILIIHEHWTPQIKLIPQFSSKLRSDCCGCYYPVDLWPDRSVLCCSVGGWSGVDWSEVFPAVHPVADPHQTFPHHHSRESWPRLTPPECPVAGLAEPHRPNSRRFPSEDFYVSGLPSVWGDFFCNSLALFIKHWLVFLPNIDWVDIWYIK